MCTIKPEVCRQYMIKKTLLEDDMSNIHKITSVHHSARLYTHKELFCYHGCLLSSISSLLCMMYECSVYRSTCVLKWPLVS